MIERTVDIAGLRLRFRGDAAAIAVVDRRYSAFACASDEPAVEIALHLRDLNTEPRAVDEPFVVSVRENRFVLSGAGVDATVDTERRSAVIHGPCTERPVDAVMRYLLASHLLSSGGALVHASAVVVNGGAWVFCGPSGAGKTTLALELDGELLCDEAVALLPHSGGVAAHATPYWTARPGGAPVAGILFPVRGVAPSWRALTSAQAVARLLPQIGPMLATEVPQALRTACRLVQSVRVAQVDLPTISHIRNWLQPRLCTEPPSEREHGVRTL